jgi:UDP-N-acetylmuramate dehydrogenase
MNKVHMEKIQEIIEYCLQKNNCELDIRYDEPMSLHTTFKVGGPADCYLCPGGENFPFFCASLLSRVKEEALPFFILGGGANIAVSDRGIRGIVLDTGAWKGSVLTEEGLIIKSGTTADEAVERAADLGLCGLEFLAGMPGTLGGAVFMNARCYGREISDVLAWTEIIDFNNGESLVKRVTAEKIDFSYKRSPFQGKDNLILAACLKLSYGNKERTYYEMKKNKQDRQDKGHYLFPCAGSAFKNNRDFGKPTGQIIDELGLKGFSLGGAQIAPFHGNIVINTGSASAADIRALMNETAERVKKAAGFILEPEIIFAGDW